jgi:hypothetical protein
MKHIQITDDGSITHLGLPEYETGHSKFAAFYLFLTLSFPMSVAIILQSSYNSKSYVRRGIASMRCSSIKFNLVLHSVLLSSKLLVFEFLLGKAKN